jgi:hypothetical protein
MLLTLPQRLHIGNEHLVGHDRGGAEHLRAPDGDAPGVLIDYGCDQIVGLTAPVFTPFCLRVDDDVSQIEVVAGGVFDVVGQGFRPRGSMFLENEAAHALADHARRHVIG